MGLPNQLATNTSRLLKNVRMFREPQHERIFFNGFNSRSVRPEPVEGLLRVFSAKRPSVNGSLIHGHRIV
jgi:hypothetical protein